MKNWICISALFLLSFFLLSCEKNEFQKVIDHYKRENNNEKLDAANFLIKNIDFHYSYSGTNYRRYMQLYDSLSNIPPSQRLDIISAYLKTNAPVSDAELSADKNTIKSDYLIKHIDFAYRLWKTAVWNKNVPFSIFCEYILPYKLYNEGFSNWDTLYHSKFNQVLQTLHFDWGIRCRAIDQKNRPFDTIVLNDFDVGTVVILKPESKGLLFDSIICNEASTKNLLLHYSSSGEHLPKINFSLNQKDSIIHLKPTRNIFCFPPKPFVFPIKLKKGVNTINIKSLNDSVGIDFIEILNYEELYRDKLGYDLIDGANYTIKNVSTGKCLEVNDAADNNASLIKQGESKKYPHQCFNIQNVDYGFFRVSPTHVKDYKKAMEVLSLSKFDNDSIGQWEYIGGRNQQWAIIPAGNGNYKILNRFNGKCLQAHPSNSLVIQNDFVGSELQLWKFERVGSGLTFDSLTHIIQGSAHEAVLRINEAIDFEVITPSYPDVRADVLDNVRIGTCKEEAQFILYALRSVGIPSAVDYTPQKPDFPAGHFWNAIILDDPQSIIYQNGLRPGIGDIPPVAKVFRNTFSDNRENLIFNKDILEVIPERLSSPCFRDVTNEYTVTRNVDIPLFKHYNLFNYKRCYLAIFNNQEWQPIYWGSFDNYNGRFKNMGVNAAYLPIYYTNMRKVVPAGYPFILYEDGVKTLVPDKKNTQTISVKRKYTWFRHNHHLNNRINGGRFQGANKKDFSDAVTLYTFRGDTEPIFYTLTSQSNKSFKYVRYIGADGSFSTISEISFRGRKNEDLKGKVIGTEGSFKNFGSTKEKAFDKNILTCFDGPTMNGSWVGLEFDKPQIIKSIRFMPRNDGNCIEEGDIYELVYWDSQKWESLGVQKATTDSLIYHNCPQNALFLLHNKTKGKDERPFTIEGGKQIWW